MGVDNLTFQKRIVLLTAFLFATKVFAWCITHSVAILTDTLEYTINVIASFVGWYSLRLSSRPKDSNHPYGHGKVEFVSAALEGILMLCSAILIVYEALNNFWHPHALHTIDVGIAILLATGLANYLAGSLAVRKGKASRSLALTATGKHMQTDTYGTLAVVAGLSAIYFLGINWLDSVIALVFALVILRSGYKILRSSLAGIMDEADEALLATIVKYLSDHRRTNWMDIHNLRIIKYGSVLHLDCHLTIPWYFNILEGHKEVEALEQMVKVNFGEQVELFVHTDGCLPESCNICQKAECPVRQFEQQAVINWNVNNVSYNRKHTIDLKETIVLS
jgi:cation diffusion facilitator family transporter